MRYFVDTEFHERGYDRIDLISVGVVAEDGRRFYATCVDGWRAGECSPWLREHVLPNLPHPDEPTLTYDALETLVRIHGTAVKTSQLLEYFPACNFLTRETIRKHLLRFVRESATDRPEFWGYFADYDWVLLCQLFGRMSDLPKHFPKYCRDLKQRQDDLGLLKSDLPDFKNEREHNALADAEEALAMWRYLDDYAIRRGK